MDYDPNWIEDPSFHGIADDSPELCRVHTLEPIKCVAFEGSNTGHRFYLCSVKNEATNCGFVAWKDKEWSPAAKNALHKLWRMYNDNSARIDEQVQNAKLVNELSDEKNKIDKKYYSMVADVKKFMDETGKKIQQENYRRIQEEVATVDQELVRMEEIHLQKTELLKNEVSMLRDDEKDAMKEEKKKPEYMLFDMLKASAANKQQYEEKLEKIKKLFDD